MSDKFIPRLTRPEKGNRYYIRKIDGGYSPCIKGKPTDPDCNVLSNCVGYAVGRFNEIGGYESCKYLKSVNAENFMQYKGSLETGQTPKVGACMVWRKGPTLDGSDGAGHVAIVEKVISDTEVITSESGYNNPTPFFTKTRKKGSDGRWGSGEAYTFLGFIYNPAPCCQDRKEQDEMAFKEGDIVEFTGKYHFASSDAISGVPCKAGKAKITIIRENGAKHPYHLVREKDGGATVYGWVDVEDVKAIPKEPEKVELDAAIKRYIEIGKAVEAAVKDIDNLESVKKVYALIGD